MDCTFLTDKGKFNYRVGAIITDGKRFLMASNPNEAREFYYSVGGRVKFGEGLEEAMLRELKEETGIDCVLDGLYCMHENFFTDDDGVFFHELSAFFVIKPNRKLLNIEDGHLTHDGPNGEFLKWIDVNTCTADFYPQFLKEFENDGKVRLITTRE